MKFKIFSVIALAVMAIALINTQLGAQAENMPAMQNSSTAICNVAQVMQKYSKTQTLMAQLKVMSEENRAKEQQQREQIQAIRAELEELNPDSDAYSKRVEDFERANIELKIFIETAESRMMRSHSRMTMEMFGEITKACQQIASARGISVVINSSVSIDPSSPEDVVMAPKVLFAAADVDITQDVINVLNNNLSAGN